MTFALRAAAAFLLISTASAAAAEIVGGEWRHPQSGVSLPASIAGMQLTGERDLSNGAGADVAAQYGADTEPLTIYVYRSAYPNAALWFERIRHAMKGVVGAPTDRVAPRSFTLAASPTPNGLREELAIPGHPRWKSTGVALAQHGEWLVKVRASSATADPAAIAARIDAVLGAMRFAPSRAKAIAKQNPLIVPGPCGDNAALRGSKLSGDLAKEKAAATVNGLVVLAETRGADGLAVNPAAWCREDSGLPAEAASVYRLRNGDTWVTLFGDSGMAVSARRLDLPPGEAPAAAASYASNATGTSLVALFDTVPAPEAAVPEALPVAAGQANGLMRISIGAPEGK